ncbi:hypothetical protein NPIL_680811 [Nephila pilipes]|uniref:Uncharacterized protein n=1 Tax=Nephila pilipes TaxID=299642 RepID=A0A8X6NUE1_NEPPI|nr:hypothetical protein NPIL_680811 [Nephila pilipes]
MFTPVYFPLSATKKKRKARGIFCLGGGWGMEEHILSVPSFFSVRSFHSSSLKRTGPAEKDEVTIEEGMSGRDSGCPRE